MSKSKAPSKEVNPDVLFKQLGELALQAGTAIEALAMKKKEILQAAMVEIQAIEKQMIQLNPLYRQTSGVDHPAVKGLLSEGESHGKTGGKRERRSREQLEADAKAIVELISKTKNGARGADIRATFPKIGPSIKDFVSKYAGVKLKTEGAKTNTKYFVG